MPHRIGYLKERIVSLENVCAAADGYNKNRPRRLRRRFTMEWLNDIATDLANDRFVWDAPREKDIYECGKKRHLRIPSLRSAVAQGAIFRVINPIIDKRLRLGLYGQFPIPRTVQDAAPQDEEARQQKVRRAWT